MQQQHYFGDDSDICVGTHGYKAGSCLGHWKMHRDFLGIVFGVIGIGGAVLGIVVWRIRGRRLIVQGE